ncbi:hypothetical protein [Natrarchaeobaculum sulfurireducens]|uniref:Uncharacterized protein n=1 Tax=Natrarchaeobaculum sulfurireducens TaxID=2044521 RepID=A0A346PMA9_9EURY|nr:hypothetical protein [Natrarchaeobaculum sulfurireducens]AXR79269.1 hypothetical protein AArc1_2961 [Natrarchaeobaculum sulfurireducens]AXR80654.1 hypothetical protein AArcMg_0631 [Natrarchaeobaculum sulfurireducens]
MSSSDDGGYVHDPSAFDEDGTRQEEGDDDWVDDPAHPTTADREFDWRGWTLVGVIVFAFIVAPVAIVLWPPDVGYLFALLILPLVPAVLLAITAVWATTRP